MYLRYHWGYLRVVSPRDGEGADAEAVARACRTGAMMITLRYAFLDEFGGVAVFTPREPFLIVAVLVVPIPRALELLVKRAHKRFGGDIATGEMKATRSSPKAVRRILEAIAQEDVAIVLTVLDKREIVKPPKDPEGLYRRTVARALRVCVEHWRCLQVTLDKRYTSPHLRQKLEWYVREEIANISGQAVMIRQEDSAAVKALQAVDYVAWAAGQKYVRGDDSYYQVIKSKVVVEETIVVK